MTGNDPVETFRQEAHELLEQLETLLLDLEQAPGDRELVDGVFRALHTVKGSGAMFGFDAVAAFTHHVETAFDQVRKGLLPASAPLIALTLAARDHIRLLLDQPGEDHREQGEVLLAELAELVGAGAPAAAAAAPAAEAKAEAVPHRWRITFRLAADAMAMGTNPLLLLDELRELGRCTVTVLTDEVPRLVEMDPESCYLGWSVVLTTTAPRSAIEDVFIFVADDARLSIDPIDDISDQARIGEILVARGEVPRQTVEEVAASRPPLGAMLLQAGKVSPDGLRSALAEQKHIVQEKTAQPVEAKSESSIRVPAERLDDLVDRVGELVIVQARLKQLAAGGGDPQIKAVAEELERLAAELRDTTMSIRMVPIGTLFGRFRRLVHDLSRDLGKKVRLVTSGEETELDKTVIERLNDPLVHMIRNAIDHAIESPEERLAAGKPAEGTVHLHAWHAGAQVAVAVSDDGHGFNTARIHAKAVENGVVAADARLGEEEILQLVFQPGFSTAREVTSVSGRGVGMDVVRRAIDALRGTIEISNDFGRGAQVTVRLPLTLAIIDGLLVRVGRGRYVIPLSAVEECVALSARDEQSHTGRDFLNIRGDLVPFLRLRELFQTREPADPYQKVVIVSTGERRIGLVVDQVLGDHQTVIKSLSKLHADVETFSGASILGDGTVALILDIAHLVAAHRVDDARLAVS